jgi:MFS family permease
MEAFGVFGAGFLMRPPAGMLSDRIGRKLLLAAALGTALLAWPLFRLLQHQE